MVLLPGAICIQVPSAFVILLQCLSLEMWLNFYIYGENGWEADLENMTQHNTVRENAWFKQRLHQHVGSSLRGHPSL